MLFANRPNATTRAHGSLYVPLLTAALVVCVLGVGYRYADLTHHRKPPPPPAPNLTWPRTAALTGTLTGMNQRVMSLRTPTGPFAVILAQSTVVLPSCGRLPTWQPGERLLVRVPGRGGGTLMAAMVRDAGPC